MSSLPLVQSDAAPTAPTRLRLLDVLMVGLCCYFIALKLFYSATASPIADEAYYWVWGRHFQLSYFDHPPLQGWLQGLSYQLFGRSPLALRWMSLLAMAVNIWIFSLVAKRIAGAVWRLLLLRTTLVYLASPLFSFFGSVVFNDYLLVTLLLGSGCLFFCFFTEVEEAGRGQMRHLFGAALLLGLAGLTKYNAVFLGLAVAGTVLVRPKLRHLLLDWRLYAAAAAAALVLLPVLLWNIEQGFASFRYHLVDRNTSGFTGLNFERMLAFIFEQPVMFSPLLIPVLVRFFWSRGGTAFQDVGKTLAIWTFWLSSLTFLYISNYSWIIWWWNIAAFVLFMPFAGKFIGRFLLPLHVLWGLFINTVLILSFTIGPVTALMGLPLIGESDNVHGWDQITRMVRNAEATHEPGFLAANRYQLASELAFALDDPDVTALSSRPDQFDYWFDGQAHIGQDALVLADGSDDMESFRSSFREITKIDEVMVEKFGIPLRRYELFLGKDFIAPPTNAPR